VVAQIVNIMMDYKQMVETAVKNGGGEKVMWSSVDVANEIMHYLKDQDPTMYDKFLRKSYESMCGKHYNQHFAEEDVDKLHSIDKDGKVRQGAYWTIEQVKEATADKKFPAGTTDWDKFVAYNAAWHDFSKRFEDKDVLCIGWLFYFADEDWKGEGKVWEYMSINK
jgi:hypothetical protein